MPERHARPLRVQRWWRWDGSVWWQFTPPEGLYGAYSFNAGYVVQRFDRPTWDGPRSIFAVAS